MDRPLIRVVADMERAGIPVDRDRLSRLSGEFAQRMAALEDEAHKLAGRKFNLGSPKQLGEILFDEMGLADVVGASAPRQARGRLAQMRWKTSPPMAMSCPRCCSTGACCRSCARPMRTR